MGERKVLNFYIPQDFDPSKLPKAKRSKQCEIRMMMPFAGQCTTCGEFMPIGKKFNAKLESIEGREYLGLRVYRFIGKCSQCNSHFSFKTDLKEMNYVPEHGIARNFENWRRSDEDVKAEKAAAAEEKDAITGLEERTLESKRQMDMLDALEELRARRSEQAQYMADPDALLAAVMDARDGDGDNAADDDNDGASTVGSRATAASGAHKKEAAPSASLTADDEALVARLFANKKRALQSVLLQLEGEGEGDEQGAAGKPSSSDVSSSTASSSSSGLGARAAAPGRLKGSGKPMIYRHDDDDDEDEDGTSDTRLPSKRPPGSDGREPGQDQTGQAPLSTAQAGDDTSAQPSAQAPAAPRLAAGQAGGRTGPIIAAPRLVRRPVVAGALIVASTSASSSSLSTASTNNGCKAGAAEDEPVDHLQPAAKRQRLNEESAASLPATTTTTMAATAAASGPAIAKAPSTTTTGLSGLVAYDSSSDDDESDD